MPRRPAIDSPRFRFGLQFVLLARHWRRALDQELEKIGLSDAVWAPLIHLHRAGDGLYQKELAQRVGVDGSSLVRLLDILGERGLLERRTPDSDRRAKLLYLTEAGRRAVAEIQQALSAAEADMLADLDDAELQTVMDAFGKIEARLQRLAAARRDADAAA